MKSITLTCLAAGILVLAACGKTDPSQGRITFSLEEGNVAEVATKGSVSNYAALPASTDFSLEIKNSLGATVYSGALGAWNPATELATGNYTATARYGDASEEGPGKPCFEGSASFVVVGGQNTNVRIPVSLGNCIVTIACTDAFKNYYPSQSFRITTPDHPDGFSFNGKGIFVAYQFSVSGSLTTLAGQEYNFPERSFRGEAATCYTVKFDVSNVGGLSITVTFNDSVQTVTLEDVQLNP